MCSKLYPLRRWFSLAGVKLAAMRTGAGFYAVMKLAVDFGERGYDALSTIQSDLLTVNQPLAFETVPLKALFHTGLTWGLYDNPHRSFLRALRRMSYMRR